MYKRIASALFAVLCLLCCLAPAAGMLVFGPSAAGANQVLAQKPVLRGEDGTWNGDYLSQLSDYVADHFCWRQELISVHNRVQAVLGASGAQDVILGREGWLYYAQTLDDYTGVGGMTSRELFTAAVNLKLMQQACQAAGARFTFVIAPNKNSLYPEHMPDYGQKSDLHDAARLLELLDQAGVNYADLFAAFASEPEELYFAHDSHWTSRGAALAADVISRSLGRESAYFSGTFAGPQAHQGDLYEMLYPAWTDPETDRAPADLNYTYTGPATRADSITLLTAGQGTGCLLAYRDSFGNLLHPYLADSFAQARFSRSTTYDLGNLAGVTDVVIELVERNLDYLTLNLPVAASPQVTVTAGTEGAEAVPLRSSETSMAGLIQWTGKLPENAAELTPVYLSGGAETFEAFQLSDGTFAAYLPVETVPDRVLYWPAGETLLAACRVAD